jgi:hypothetical protein
VKLFTDKMREPMKKKAIMPITFDVFGEFLQGRVPMTMQRGQREDERRMMERLIEASRNTEARHSPDSGAVR